MFTSYLLCWVCRNHFLLLLSKSPNGAILLLSPGRKPWVNRSPYLLSPKGAAQPQSKCPNTRVVSAAPKGAHSSFGPCVPRVPFRALPSFHPGLCRSVALAGLIYVFTTNQLLCCFDAVALPSGDLLLAALPYNGVIQTATTNWRIVLKISYFAPKHRHNVLKVKEESLLDWLLDIWEQKQKKRIRLLWT